MIAVKFAFRQLMQSVKNIHLIMVLHKSVASCFSTSLLLYLHMASMKVSGVRKELNVTQPFQ